MVSVESHTRRVLVWPDDGDIVEEEIIEVFATLNMGGISVAIVMEYPHGDGVDLTGTGIDYR